jgi:hypothetical protein
MKYLFAAALFACLTPFIAADDTPAKKDKPDEKTVVVEENPFKKAKVGDYAEFKMTIAVAGQNVEGTYKNTVSEKTEKEATLKSTSSAGGFDLPAQEIKIDLSKPYDPSSTTGLPKGDDIKVEKLGDGKEKIKIGDKEYDCTWTKSKIKGKAKDMDIDAEVKVWTCKSVPLGGTVKMEMNSTVAGMAVTVTMELSETGSKK